jgi:transcriptional regulator
MGVEKTDFIKGTLDMLILKVLALEPMHGWGISERIQQMSGDLLRVQQGSLYASLHRLTREGWIRSGWRMTENNRRARYYALTRSGERQLQRESEHWERVSAGVIRIMAATA